MQEFKSSICQNSVQLKSIIGNHEKLEFSMRHKVAELENQKVGHVYLWICEILSTI